MGRNIPSREIISSSSSSSIHYPILSLAICVIWIASLVTTISSLCGIWSKKSSKSSSQGNNNKIATNNLTANIVQSSSSSKGKSTNSADNNVGTPTPTTSTITNDDDNDNDDAATNRPLPPPPSAAKLEFGESKVIKRIDKSSSFHQNYKPKISTRKKLTSSISLKMSMKIKDKASDFRDKATEFKEKASEFKDKASDFGHRKAAKNDSESLWTKRIILGEKCKLPNEDDGVTVVSNDGHAGQLNNNEFTTTTKFTRVMSKSVSSINPNAISSLRQEEKFVRVDHEEKGKEKVVQHFDDEEDGNNDEEMYRNVKT